MVQPSDCLINGLIQTTKHSLWGFCEKRWKLTRPSGCQKTDMFLSLRHSVLTGSIIVLYLLLTLILSAPQGVQICNLDHVPLPHLKQVVTLLPFIKKSCTAHSLNVLWAANGRVHYHQVVRMHIPFLFS